MLETYRFGRTVARHSIPYAEKNGNELVALCTWTVGPWLYNLYIAFPYLEHAEFYSD